MIWISNSYGWSPSRKKASNLMPLSIYVYCILGRAIEGHITKWESISVTVVQSEAIRRKWPKS